MHCSRSHSPERIRARDRRDSAVTVRVRSEVSPRRLERRERRPRRSRAWQTQRSRQARTRGTPHRAAISKRAQPPHPRVKGASTVADRATTPTTMHARLTPSEPSTVVVARPALRSDPPRAYGGILRRQVQRAVQPCAHAQHPMAPPPLSPPNTEVAAAPHRLRRARSARPVVMRLSATRAPQHARTNAHILPNRSRQGVPTALYAMARVRVDDAAGGSSKGGQSGRSPTMATVATTRRRTDVEDPRAHCFPVGKAITQGSLRVLVLRTRSCIRKWSTTGSGPRRPATSAGSASSIAPARSRIE